MTTNTQSNLAFIFPGQGSQTVGMLTPFLGQPDAIIENTFEEANQALGYDLFSLIQNDPDQQLNLTTHTQVAILATSVAIWRVWAHHCQKIKGHVITPQFMAGHSLGEYSALCAAGYLGFSDTLKLVKFRAESMQNAVPVGVGAMAAILGLADDVVKNICQKVTESFKNTSVEVYTTHLDLGSDGRGNVDEDSTNSTTARKNFENNKFSDSKAKCVVEAVNFNTIGQVVIAGHQKAVEQAIEALKEAGAKRALLLNVSAPFHTSLMQKVADALLLKLNDLSLTPTGVQIVQNINADVVDMNVDTKLFKKQLAQQAASPVLWSQSIEVLKQKGVTHMVECGTGKILQGLNKRIDGLSTDSLFDIEQILQTIEKL